MFPGGLMQMLGAEDEALPVLNEAEQLDEREMDPETIRLVMAKRKRLQALKAMLQQAGYGDLARMASVRKERLDDGY